MITAKAITLNLFGKQILHQVDFSLRAGEIVTLCGPNGAGKSTLLSCLAGEHRQCADRIRYADVPVSQLSPLQLAQQRMVLEQSPSLSTDFTVQELIELGAPLVLPPDDLIDITSQIAIDLGFGDFKHEYVSRLSGGQRHRVHLGRVLVQLQAHRHLGYNSFLFLDEPTASLDLAYQISILQIVQSLSQQGIGVLIVLHDLNLAAALSHRVVLLQGGHVVKTGVPNEIFQTALLSEVYQTPILVEYARNGQKVIQPLLP